MGRMYTRTHLLVSHCDYNVPKFIDPNQSEANQRNSQNINAGLAYRPNLVSRNFFVSSVLHNATRHQFFSIGIILKTIFYPM